MPEVSPAATRLEALRMQYSESDTELVTSIVRSVLTTMRGDLTANETSLLAEIEELAATVANARAEIAAIGADDITESHIPSATDELDAIVAHTAEATNGILECCETIDTVIPRLTETDAAQMQNVVTRIYEACSFQDITGQRITKVVTTLKAIEAKVAHIIGTFGHSQPSDKSTDKAISSEADLLNGPQLPAHAMDQSDIDKLLASFE